LENSIFFSWPSDQDDGGRAGAGPEITVFL
jgi:hypothetical protein